MTTNNAGTPRTDAAKWETVVGREKDGSSAVEWVVDTEFARDLERELAAEKARSARVGEALETVLASAHPHPLENLAMFEAWQSAKEALA